jgi:hypothetical protein
VAPSGEVLAAAAAASDAVPTATKPDADAITSLTAVLPPSAAPTALAVHPSRVAKVPPAAGRPPEAVAVTGTDCNGELDGTGAVADVELAIAEDELAVADWGADGELAGLDGGSVISGNA